MKPELQAKLDAAKARQKAADEKLIAKATPDPVAVKIAGLEKTIGELEAANRSRPVAIGAKSLPDRVASDKIEIDGNRFSIIKTAMVRNSIHAMGEKAWEHHGAEYERDAIKAYYAARSREMQKTMTFGDEPSGGFLVMPQVRQPIDALRSETWLDKVGVQRLSGVTDWPVILPRQTSDNTSSWVGESTATTPTDPAMDEIRLNKKILVNATRLSLHLMRSSPGVAESMARRSIAASMTRKLELGIIEGGTGAPTGLKDIANIGSVSFSAATADAKQVAVNQMILELIQDNVPTSGAAFLMSEKVWANLAGVLLTYSTFTSIANRAASGPLGALTMIDASGQKWLGGYKVYTTNNLTVSTTGELYFGQWGQMIVADGGAAEVVMTTEGETLTLARRALLATFQEVDMTVEHPEAFAKGTAFTVALS